MSDVWLRLQDVVYHVNNRPILWDITCAIHRGEIVTVIGPNGAGKTTLLRIMMGLTHPTAGIVWRHPQWRVGYMPQKLVLNPLLPMTVRRFLSMFLDLDNLAADQKSLLHHLGVLDRLEHSVHDLSGGEFQRMMLARTLCQRPTILVLDEPTQALDVVGQREFYHIIHTAAKQLNCAVVLVSHDLNTVMANTDRVLCVNGHICCQGTAGVVQKDQAFEALFGSTLPESLSLYTHHHDHVHDPIACAPKPQER